MIVHRFVTPVMPVFALILSACGSSVAYPSLTPRPIEHVSLAEPSQAGAQVPPAETSGALSARYAAMVARARDADQAFHRTLDQQRATVLAGRAASTGDDAWIAAQEAFSRIEAARAPVSSALSDLDAERSGPQARGDSNDAAMVARAFEQVQALDMAEHQALAAIAPPD